MAWQLVGEAAPPPPPPQEPINPDVIGLELRRRGLSENHIQGMLANIKRESGFDPDIMGDKGTAHGLFQHRLDRATALKKAVPDWQTNYQGQIDFALNEPEGKAYQAQQFANPADAARYFSTNFERPANGKAEADQRAAMASGGGRWKLVDNGQVDRMRAGQGSPTVQAANGLSPLPPAPPPEAPEKNRLRPKQTIWGEFTGGMKELGQGLSGGKPAPIGPYTPRPGTPEAAQMPPAPPPREFHPFGGPASDQVVLGAARMMGAPFAPLFNASTDLWGSVRDQMAQSIPGFKSNIPGTSFTPADALANTGAFATDMLAPMGVSKAVKTVASPLSKLLGPTAAERKAADLMAIRGEGRMQKDLAGMEAERLSSQAKREAQTGKEAIAREVGTESRKLGQQQTEARDRSGQLFAEQTAQIERAKQAELAKSSRAAPEQFQSEAFPAPPKRTLTELFDHTPEESVRANQSFDNLREGAATQVPKERGYPEGPMTADQVEFMGRGKRLSENGAAAPSGPVTGAPLSAVPPPEQSRGAMTTQQFGEQYKNIYTRERKKSQADFNQRYSDIRNSTGDQAFPVENRRAAEAQVLAENPGVTRPALNLQSERITEGMQSAGDAAAIADPALAQAQKVAIGGVKPGKDEIFDGSKMRKLLAEQLRKDRFGQGRDQAQAIFAEAMGPASEGGETLSTMISNRQRLRMAHRAAVDAGHDPIARQFKILEDGITADIEAAAKAAGREDVVTALRQTDLDYGKEHATLFGNKATTRRTANKPAENIVDSIILQNDRLNPVGAIQDAWRVIKDPAERQQLVGSWFKRGIDEAIDPKNGEWSRDKFLGWVNKYRSPGTEDQVLRTAFGSNYEKFNELVDTMQKAQPKGINDLAKETVKNLRSQRDTKLAAIDEGISKRRGPLEAEGATRAKQLDKDAAGKIKAADAGRTAAEASIQKSLDEAVAKLTGTQKNRPGIIQRVGAYKAIGALGVLPGALALGGSNPTTILASAVVGGTMLLTPMAWSKFMQSRKGMDLLIRGMRAAPGTTEAVQWASQANHFARQLQGGNEPKEQQNGLVPPPSIKPPKPPEDPRIEEARPPPAEE